MSHNFCFLVKSIKSSMLAKYIISDGYPVLSILKHDSKILTGMKWFLENKLGVSIWGSYNQSIRDYEGTYIVFDEMIRISDLIYIRNKNLRARIVLMYWNPVENVDIPINEVKNLGIELWSYSRSQCQRYDMNYNTYFFCEEMYAKALNNSVVEYDIFFAGKDKGRLSILESYMKKHKSLRWKLHVIPDHFWQLYKNRKYKLSVSYEELQAEQSRAKAIMEIVSIEDVELTMRSLDALILKKKLITNIPEELYNGILSKDNVFFLNSEAGISLEAFLQQEFSLEGIADINEYRIDRWIDRVMMNHQIEG